MCITKVGFAYFVRCCEIHSRRPIKTMRELNIIMGINCLMMNGRAANDFMAMDMDYEGSLQLIT